MGQIGKYETIVQLGTGAMGTVYRARDTALGREVALKTIRTGADIDFNVRERFYREARACARLQHPNIIVVYDLGEAENMAYIAMELLLGSDFRRIIQERQPMPLQLKIAAVAQVCDAVAHAHRHGVIHRDIKPSNLFLTEGGQAKVLDFGIARLPSSRLTVAGQILGTPNYMAPEQILSRPADGRADLFSVAVVFFELLTYVHPFQSSVIPRRIAQAEPDSLFDYDSSLPLILEKVMTRGLAKDPDQRYQTGDEFAADLNAVLDALRQNASPTFSGFELPSERALPPPPSIAPEPESAAGRLVPPGQDAHEWRLSEALRLLPAFEAMIEKQDLDKATATFTELESRVGGDSRFTEAIRLCRSRLEQLEAAARVAGAAVQPARRQTKPGSAAGSRVASVGVPTQPSPAQMLPPQANQPAVDLDSTVFFDPPTGRQRVPVAPEFPAAEEWGRTDVSLYADTAGDGQLQAESDRTATMQEAQAPPPRPPVWANKRLIISAGIIVCAGLLLLAGIVASRRVRIEPAVATATVPIVTRIYASAGSNASVIGAVPGGTQLNILKLPVTREQTWTLIQSIKPNVLRPGYVETSALRDWHGNSGPAMLGLMHLWGKGESGSNEEIETQMRQLAGIVSQFSSEPVANDARLDLIRLRLALARRLKNSGGPPGDFELQLHEAQQLLQPLRGVGNLQASVVEFDRQINSLQGEARQVPPSTTPSAPTGQPPAGTVSPKTRADLAALLKQANELRQAGDYAGAESLIQKILRMDPRNAEAKSLQDRINRGRDAEAK